MGTRRSRAIVAAVAAAVAIALLAMLLLGRGNPFGEAETAGEVCSLVAERFDELQRPPPRAFSEAEQMMEGLVEAAEDGQDALADLDPPAEEGSYERYLDARDQVSDLLAEALEAVRDRDPERYRDARQRANEGIAERRRLARRAGVPECAAAIERGPW
jgi:hypothetical protein